MNIDDNVSPTRGSAQIVNTKSVKRQNITTQKQIWESHLLHCMNLNYMTKAYGTTEGFSTIELVLISHKQCKCYEASLKGMKASSQTSVSVHFMLLI